MPCSAEALHGMLRYRPITFSANEDFAQQLDAADPLKHVGDALLAH